VRQLLPRIAQTLPPELRIQPLADQSIFVRGAVNGVIREAVIAAALTGLMILIFLGSWRSTVIIAVSIPLAILTSVIVLSFLHQTINTMTLGGLALAVGILVDDATVTIENIERHLGEGAELHDGILEGAAQIAVPALVPTLCICIVFLPMFFLSGVAGYLFAPLGEAVIFAMNHAGSELAMAYRDSREIVRAINEASRLHGRMIGRRCHCPVSSTAIRAAMQGACVTAAISSPMPQMANIDGCGLCSK
jgi:multidrug efflux pump subunit AcrB